MLLAGRIETTAFQQIFRYRGTFGLDTPSALDQRIAFEKNCQVVNTDFVGLYKIEESSMSNDAEQALSVRIQDLSPVFVAYTYCEVDQAAGNFSDQIRDGFQSVKDWVMQKGYELSGLKVIGVPHVSDGQLTGYECCVELPKTEDINTGVMPTKQLTGGTYAILTLEKDSATIGETIGRFFAEYVPGHQLMIDDHRPSYEMYYEHIMDFCVPIS